MKLVQKLRTVKIVLDLFNSNATTWNMLPHEIVNAKTVNSFKVRLDEYMGLDKWKD